MRKKIILTAGLLLALLTVLTACSSAKGGASEPEKAEEIDLDSQGGKIVEIREAGTYILTGSFKGQILVDIGEEEKAQLILRDVSVKNAKKAGIRVESAGEAELVLEGENSISADSSGGAVLVKADLVIGGDGTLRIKNKTAHGIVGRENLTINGGTLEVDTKEKGIRADKTLRISEGSTIRVNSRTEGMEARYVEISGGSLHIQAADDGINAAVRDDKQSKDCSILISGGDIFIDTVGDGLDSNGDLSMTGGNLLILGAETDKESALDYNGTAVISGGICVAAGYSKEAQSFGPDSAQGVIFCNLPRVIPENTEILLETEEGEPILNLNYPKSWNSLVISTPELLPGKAYVLTAGGEKETVYVNESESGT